MKIFLQYFTLPFIALLSMHIIIVFYNVMNPLLSIIILAFFCQNFSISYLLLICGDIHPNPGPKDKGNLSICHWNINSIPAHNFIKLSLLQSFNSIHKFDLICISESFLNSSFSCDNSALDLNGYKLVRSDHPQDIRRGGVCIYYKESLPINFLNISNLPECLTCELMYENKKCFIVSLYRSPSQTADEFDFFLKEFENIIENISTPSNPNLVMVIGDFNAKSTTWKTDDHDTPEGVDISTLTSSYGLTQLITEPTHILPNSSTCIDLIFSNQPNMVFESGVYPSLHVNCHHQIIYAKINFKIFYPPPYERQIWHYNRSNIQGIKLSIENINWERVFHDLNVDKQVELFQNYLMNIFENYIPNEVITINERESPWITSAIKNKIQEKNSLYKSFLRNGKTSIDLDKVNEACQSLNLLVSESKAAYYTRLRNKLSNPKTSSKAYWSILKSFFSDKKIPVVPPLVINDEYVTDFKTKTEIFNNHFSKQCSLIENSSTLPQIPMNPQMQNSFSSFQIEGDEILKIIRSLDINKSHGFDKISAKMLKICDSSIVKPLLIIFNNSLNRGVFPDQWKKANVTPIHKKGNKNDITNYRPISVLPLCGKIFEKLIYNAVYNFFLENNIFNINQSGFRTGDSCVNQLISIPHNIFQSFDLNPPFETRGVFLDISKAFDRVWHDGVIFKLKSNGVAGNVLKLIENFLDNRYQRVILNGQCSSWTRIKAGVPQGSILGPLLFLIYINDISVDLESNVKLFADDTSLFSVISDPTITARLLNNDLEKIQQWAFQWKMSFNPDPSKQAQEIIFSKKNIKPNHPDLYFNQLKVKRVSTQKHLGVILDEKLNFNAHLKTVFDKTTKCIGILRKLRFFIPRHSLITIYKSFIRSQLDYADVIYDKPSNESFLTRIESIQYNAALAITGTVRCIKRKTISRTWS